MIVYVWRDYGNSDHIATLLNDVPNLLVLDTNHVLPIHLQQVVLHQKAVPGGRGVHGYGAYSSILELEPNMARRVLSRNVRWEEV